MHHADVVDVADAKVACMGSSADEGLCVLHTVIVTYVPHSKSDMQAATEHPPHPP